MPLDRAPAGWMDVQLAELAAEVGMLVDAELLVTKENHQVVHQRVVDLLELLVAQRFGQVGTVVLGTDHRRHLAHLDGWVARGVIPTVAIASSQSLLRSVLRIGHGTSNTCPLRAEGHSMSKAALTRAPRATLSIGGEQIAGRARKLSPG